MASKSFHRHVIHDALVRIRHCMFFKPNDELILTGSLMRRLRPFVIFLAALFLLLFPAYPDRAWCERPNIIVILADDLGYSDLGCYGGEIRTPRIDRLAKNGLRMTQLYNAARCCSTRASLLTGLYPHQAGVGAMSADNQKPGYRGFLTERCVTVPTLLRTAGYQTFMSGKWHLRGKGNPDCVPTSHGFDEFFGHFRAYASYYRQDLFTRMPADRPRRMWDKNRFYATDAITDCAIDFVQQANATEKPFFLYVAYNAPHFPLQAPRDQIDAYIDVYRSGWDKIRQSRFARMLELGLVDEGTTLSARGHVTKVPDRNADSPYYDRQIPAWDDLPADRQNDLVRRMATYAAMVEIMDRNIGRLVDQLTDLGQLENTLIVFLSDNGACAEWDPYGFDNNPYPTNRLYRRHELAEMGGPSTFHSYGTGWANVSNTPFRLYKHYNHEGGISAPAIVHWPEGIDNQGTINRDPAHVIDLAPTFLALAGVEHPAQKNGTPLLPLAGQSLLEIWRGGVPLQRPLFFEHEGNRAVRLGKWKLVWTNYQQVWELYDISRDRSETRNLAEQLPQRVEQMSKLWEQWARNSFVEMKRVEQPAQGMPKIYYMQDQSNAASTH